MTPHFLSGTFSFAMPILLQLTGRRPRLVPYSKVNCSWNESPIIFVVQPVGPVPVRNSRIPTVDHTRIALVGEEVVCTRSDVDSTRT
ncbi:hypothetical protein PHLGIDRAFT_253985 [Phlebiopsis gigantea 11061_1 CR5-6]|uniref:Uncharacterized protein n=1 Tax=Phlebiopsis gigantea (strain 11061_1 CR5-6) TaxID=745531 RepID=A0A0C3S4R9_PHLG1|nr:hypothetical protein PHLGIDRAFT_253985 [Phlebiopsis gigantea 11061_1 CR5-6]